MRTLSRRIGRIRLIAGVSAVWMGIQFVVPWSYYLRDSDEYDSRWAWRMLADTDKVVCTGGFTQGGEEVNLASRFLPLWPSLVTRGFEVVTREVSRKLCAESAARPLVLVRRCEDPEGNTTVIGDPEEDLCQRP